MDDGQNLYESPAGPLSQPAGQGSGVRGFAKGWLITDLVFSAMKVLFVALGLIGLQAGMVQGPLLPTVWFELACNAGVCAIGTTAAILLLKGRRAGLALGMAALLLVALSIAVTTWQFTITYETMGGGPQAVGAVIGYVATVLIRVALNVVYLVVLLGLWRRLR
jgi:hypothetical protein